MSAELKFFPLAGRYTREIILRPEPAKLLVSPMAAPEIDHGLVEAILARFQKKAERAQFWHDHADIMFGAMIDRGLSEAVAEAVLRDHFAEVRRINSERMAMPQHRRLVERSPINFNEPPPVGAEIAIGGKVARVIAVDPYVRRDGGKSFVIRWDIEGRKATSGLRAKGIRWDDDQTRGGDHAAG